MSRYVLERVLLLAPVLLGVALITFVLMRAAPGNPFAGERISTETQDRLMRQYGFDRPYVEQFVRYVGKAVRGDLGVSVKLTGEPVSTIIAQRFPVSLALGTVAAIIIVVVGIPLGTLGAVKQNTWVDYVSMTLALVGYSVPSFVLGLILLLWLASGLHLLPVGGWGRPEHFVIPAFVLGIQPASVIARYVRASMLEVIRQDYVRTARAKGVQEHMVILRHALRNALVPVITVLGTQFAWLITGSFVIEYMFAIPGLGQLFVQSAVNLDYPLIMGLALFYASIVAVMNIVVDLLYTALNPRVTLDSVLG